MRFGPTPLKDAQGAILAHSIALSDGSLRKGKILDAQDLARLSAAGHSQVITARPDAGDCTEDAAATALATALLPDATAAGLRLSPAHTGRVNLYATGAGVLCFDPATLHRINLCHPMLTLACLPLHSRLQDGEMVATLKTISYALPQTAVDAACAIAQNAQFHRAAPKLQTCALIETSFDGSASKGRAALQTRLARLKVTLTHHQITPHDSGAIQAALTASTADIVLILTASATCDENDLAPSALRAAGGTVTRFGMPVDPGNLLFFGTLKARPVIGLPGCAKSPALNGADWVLERLICGLPLTSQDIAEMGVGGLLKEIPTRPRPRDSQT